MVELEEQEERGLEINLPSVLNGNRILEVFPHRVSLFLFHLLGY